MTELIARGKSQSEAAASVGLSLRTVQRWVTTGVFPERKRRIFSSHVDAFGPYIEKRVAEGCTNASQLWRDQAAVLPRKSIERMALGTASLRTLANIRSDTTREEKTAPLP